MDPRLHGDDRPALALMADEKMDIIASLAEATGRPIDQTDFVPYRDRILAERLAAWIGQ